MSESLSEMMAGWNLIAPEPEPFALVAAVYNGCKVVVRLRLLSPVWVLGAVPLLSRRCCHTAAVAAKLLCHKRQFRPGEAGLAKRLAFLHKHITAPQILSGRHSHRSVPIGYRGQGYSLAIMPPWAWPLLELAAPAGCAATLPWWEKGL
jgi:hypothetical protein